MSAYVAEILLLAAGCLAGAAATMLLLRPRTRKLERLVDNTIASLERLEVQFARFAPLDVVERLSDPDATVATSRRTVTVLFADLKGFTGMCDRLDPDQTVTILNGYFQHMGQAIARNHGRLTELIGDGLLALFGALQANPWQAQDAVLAALAMREELAGYNAALRARALPELRFGIGIHRGEVLAGVMGNESLSKFGVVGDPINVAARVERLTRVHEVDVLITDAVRSELDARFVLRDMPPMQVKGKAEPIATYHLVGRAEAAVPAPADAAAR